MKRPNLKVIDQAIQRIEDRKGTLSCLALFYAHEEATGFNTSCNSSIYVKQYTAYVRSVNKGKLPSWWNIVGRGPTPRLKALRGFRQACIDAAQNEAA
jgi:hypothetical protein